jgi:ABC-type branched-subunit amino acid transport system ATPase component
MLEVRGLAADYGDVRALWDVSLDARAGEIVALIAAHSSLASCG